MSTIVGYTYRADIYCPDCIHVAMGWATFMARQSVADAEAILDILADERGIDREDEYSFDAGYFPKRVLGGTLEGDERCGQCDEPFNHTPSPKTLGEARELASKGAALLDARCHGWARRVDVDELSIESAFYCILGQVFDEGYSYGLETLGLDNIGAMTHGFCGDDDVHVKALDIAWRELIAERTADGEG